MMPGNLLELCLSPDLGGLELYMMRAAKALHNDFNVISAINPKGKLEQYYKGTEHKYVFVEKNSNLLMLGAAYKLAQVIDENKISIVHLHWTKDIPIAVLAKHFSKQKPKLTQTRNMTMTRFKDDFYHRHLYKNIDLMLPVTQQVAKQLKRFIPAPVRPEIEVLYMGTDKVELLDEETLSAFKVKHKMDNCFSVGLVGRIEATKGQHLLIEAIASLQKEGYKVEAFFVGHAMQEGYIDTLKAKAKSLEVSDAVHFLGFMKNPMHFMQACDAMVLATPCETFGLVVIEAMSVGTPMVTTNACGPLEIIEDKQSGLLFEKDSVDSLHQTIKMLLTDVDMCRSIALVAQKKVAVNFSNELQFEKLTKILQRL